MAGRVYAVLLDARLGANEGWLCPYHGGNASCTIYRTGRLEVFRTGLMRWVYTRFGQVGDPVSGYPKLGSDSTYIRLGHYRNLTFG